MTEMFHVTHSALHIGLTSTIQHYNKLLRLVPALKQACNANIILSSIAAKPHGILQLQYVIQTSTTKYLESCLRVFNNISSLCVVFSGDVANKHYTYLDLAN